MDLDDAVRYYIVEELISHTESYHGSTYLFRDRGEGEEVQAAIVAVYNKFDRLLGRCPRKAYADLQPFISPPTAQAPPPQAELCRCYI